MYIPILYIPIYIVYILWLTCAIICYIKYCIRLRKKFSFVITFSFSMLNKTIKYKKAMMRTKLEFLIPNVFYSPFICDETNFISIPCNQNKGFKTIKKCARH